MPQLPSAKLRRRRAGEIMRRILLDMLVATRPRRTFFQAFLDAKATFGSGYKLVEDVRLREESYGSLMRMALGLGRLMSSATRPGEIVGVMTPNAAPTLALVLGLSATGRVPAMLNYTAGAEGLRAACTVARISNIVTSRAFLEKARLTQLVEQLPNIRVHYLEDMKARVSLSDKLWILRHQLFPGSLGSNQQPEDAAIVLFTSGSEGRPKGVVHSHNSLLSNVAQIRAVADFTPLDKFMIALPVFHSFGLTCGIVMPLVSGCKAFLYPSPLHYRIIPELVYDRNCTVLFGTSTFLGNYGKFAHPYDFGRLPYVVAGVEKLSEDVRRLWIEKFGIRVLEGYGVTECAPVIAVNVPMACRIGSVGQIAPGMRYELEPVPGIENAGVLHVTGPNVMKGYLLYEKPGEIQPPQSIHAGWYSTGGHSPCCASTGSPLGPSRCCRNFSWGLTSSWRPSPVRSRTRCRRAHGWNQPVLGNRWHHAISAGGLGTCRAGDYQQQDARVSQRDGGGRYRHRCRVGRKVRDAREG
jgi:acyl-[acyl-carrier-protein]-phospholipid O-acyltransferase / long-chain-fatty-acid--[acyl-carrier-protein] ligase